MTKKTSFNVLAEGFKGTLFCPENHDDRVVIVLQVFGHKYRHINFKTGSHDLGIFPVIL